MNRTKEQKLAEARAMKVNDLKAELKERGLPTTGLKAVLLERLEKAIEADPDEVNDGLQTPNVATAEQIESVQKSDAKSASTETEPVVTKDEEPMQVESKEETKKDSENNVMEKEEQKTSDGAEAKSVETKEEDVKPTEKMQVEEKTNENQRGEEQKKEEEKKRKREEEEKKTSEEPTKTERDEKKAKTDETPTPTAPSTSVPSSKPDHAEPVKTARTVLSSAPPVQPFLNALSSAARSTARQPRQQEPRVVPPSTRPHTNTLLITGFVRPLNTKKVTVMLEGKGRKIVDFWMNDIKTHCYVTFSSEEQAAQLREEIYGLVWPEDNPDAKPLHADFVPSDALHRAKNGGLLEPVTDDRAQKRPALLVQRGLAAAGVSSSPVKKEVTVTNPDKLFQRTEAQPSIYYLPLTKQQIEERKAESAKSTSSAR
eukprot:TRINITY_DN14789_c0_g1_i1.p1 TRINITY_DN14789_c0_g1~~TRINITY_DN14789_c0_g1_i1.p1  ORF type:complete len:428 (+),score=134.95 TRINITY_DN14789_c0_g1_i1:89-1372(+)